MGSFEWMKKDCGSSLFFLPESPSISPLRAKRQCKDSTLPSQLHPCSFTSLSALINPFFPLLRRFPRASLALYRNSREPFPLTDRNKNTTHRSASLQRPNLLLLSSFFSSLSSFFTGEGTTRVQPATLFTPGMNLRRWSELDTTDVLTALSRITCPTPFVR